jgi:hypothetical protein
VPFRVAGEASIPLRPSWHAWIGLKWPVRFYAPALRYRFRLPRRASCQRRLMLYRPTKRVSVAPRVPFSTPKCWFPLETVLDHFRDTGAETPFSPFRAYMYPRRPPPRPQSGLPQPPPPSAYVYASCRPRRCMGLTGFDLFAVLSSVQGTASPP